jgi:hypothetical protein
MSKQVLKRVSPHTSVWMDEEDETMNNKKQTSIEWLLSSNKQLYYDLHEGRIHQHEYHPKLKEIEAKAKQMHKEEVELFGALCCSKTVHKNLWSLDKLYNETFGGDNEN